MAPVPCAAQDWLILGGVLDFEGWASDSGSRTLTRNFGRPGMVGRLSLWGGIAPSPQVQLVALVEANAGAARRGVDGADPEMELEGLLLRYAPSRRFVFDAGRLLSPVGAYGPRRLSPVNPLIDRPDVYPPNYPWGAQVAGVAGPLDYRVAVISLPASNPQYVPVPGHAARLAGGLGLTPFVGAHLGMSFTWGPYLGPDMAPRLPAGTQWRDFGQWVLGFDARLSRGYADFHGELAFSSYDAPTVAEPLDGIAAYAELKYTWTPRFYTAVRVQYNDYAFIRPRTPPAWTGIMTRVHAGEIGVGYRVARGLLFKVSYQQDDWATQLDGRVAAAQLSYEFDAAGWLARR
jgi:hypothetical protein